MSVLTLALPSNATALVKRRQHAQIDQALHRQIERRIVGGEADGAAEGQRVLGDRATSRRRS